MRNFEASPKPWFDTLILCIVAAFSIQGKTQAGRFRQTWSHLRTRTEHY